MAVASARVICSLKYLVTLQQSIVIKMSACMCRRSFILGRKALSCFKVGGLGLTHPWAGTRHGGINLARWDKSDVVDLSAVLPKPLA